MRKPDQGGSQLDRSQLFYPENLSLVRQEVAQPSITKRPTIMGNVDVRMSKEGGSNNFKFFRTRVSVDITKPLC